MTEIVWEIVAGIVPFARNQTHIFFAWQRRTNSIEPILLGFCHRLVLSQ